MNSDLVKIFKSFIMNNIDEEALKANVQEIRDSNPDFSNYELSTLLINNTAVTSSISGVVTGAIPWPLTLLFAVPDFAAVMICQVKMILKIAILAGKDPSADERFPEIAACIGVSAGAAAGTIGVRKIIDSGISPFMLTLIFRSFAKSFSSKFVPIAGAISGGAINYAATLAAGKVARNFYFPEDAEVIEVKDDKNDDDDSDKTTDSTLEDNPSESEDDVEEEEDIEFDNCESSKKDIDSESSKDYKQ